MPKRLLHKVFLYSGQGSQYPLMGLDLYENLEVYRNWMNRLDQVAKPLLGQSVLEELYRRDRHESEILNRLRFTHPAIFMSEYALTMAYKQKGIRPDLVAGSSLGEYASLAAAEAADPEELLDCLVRQALLIESNCTPGGMLAVLDTPDILKQLNSSLKDCSIASINYDSHFVLAGHSEHLEAAKNELSSKGVTSQRLPVDYAFHSKYIEPAKHPFLLLAADITFKKPVIPIVSCAQGAIMGEPTPEHLWTIIRNPVQLSRAADAMLQNEASLYVDIGQGGTMANFMKRNAGEERKVESWACMTPFKKEYSRFQNSVQALTDLNCSIVERKGGPMAAYLFPGQGSQQVGMGKEVFAQFPDLTDKADRILGYSLQELCLRDPENKLSNTAYTQPALYVVNVLSYLAQAGPATVDYVAGHSLGEYCALFAAGMYDFETGLRLVQRRGELMAGAAGGGMAAVVGLSETRVEQLLREQGIDSIDVANFNTPSQIVISGPLGAIEQVKAVFEAEARMFVPLKVSGAFHSRYMAEAGHSFRTYLDTFDFTAPKIPVIANVTARPYELHAAKELLAQQMTSAVKWTESIRYMMGAGVTEFVEVGPGQVLTGLVRGIKREAQPLVVEPVKTPVLPEASRTEALDSVRKLVAVGSVETAPQKIMPPLQISERQDSAWKNPVRGGLTAHSLGSGEFKQEYKLKYAYLGGAMFKGISSPELVAELGKAGMMGFLGTGGLSLDQAEAGLVRLQQLLPEGTPYGVNLLHHLDRPDLEERMVDLLLRYGVHTVEAAAFLNITPALVKYRLQGLSRNSSGAARPARRVIAKISRPEVAQAFLQPAPAKIVDQLLAAGKITAEEAKLSAEIAMADDLSVETDSAGHTDHSVAYAVFPAIRKLRDDMMLQYGYRRLIRVGAAGGIGTPEAVAAAFIMGADFIVTGSINQCTVEAGTSSAVKAMLQQLNVQDTEYAPAGDMFELGAKVQVMKKGVFFPARANKLYDLYRLYNSIDEIDDKSRQQITEKYFKCSFEAVYADVRAYYPAEQIEKAERNPKYKMALIFRWYFGRATRLAIEGDEGSRVDYQVYCGPAMGSFNQWVKGTALEDWQNRRVARIGASLMEAAADVLSHRFTAWNSEQ